MAIANPPAAPDFQGFVYDVNLCFAEADRTRVEQEVFSRLLDAGLRVATFSDTTEAQGYTIDEITRIVEQARYTVVLMTPALFQDSLAEFANVLAQNLGLEQRNTRLKLILFAPMPRAQIPSRLRVYPIHDLTQPERFESELERLIKIFKRPLGGISCLLSYSPADEPIARRIQNDLQMNGIRVWFVADDLKIGDPLAHTMDRAVEQHDKLLLVLSENSIHSAWVQNEISTALVKEKQNNAVVLFPIRLDNALLETTEPWAEELRQRRIGDFTNWTNPLVYQNAINRLLRDLNAKP